MRTWTPIWPWLGPAILALTAGCVVDGSSSISTLPSTSPDGAFESTSFAMPLTVAIPESMLVYETSEAVVLTGPAEDGAPAERFVIFRTQGSSPAVEVFGGFETSGPEAGSAIRAPWPADLETWLSGLDMFELRSTDSATVAGEASSLIAARSSYDPPATSPYVSLRIILVGPAGDGTDVTMQAGEMDWRFVVFEDRPLAIAY